MIKILDVTAKNCQTIRFLYTPAGTTNLFGRIREEDIVTMINRSIPVVSKDCPFKDHGTLLFGDPPETFLNRKFSESIYEASKISADTLKLVRIWIRHNGGNNVA